MIFRNLLQICAVVLLAGSALSLPAAKEEEYVPVPAGQLDKNVTPAEEVSKLSPTVGKGDGEPINKEETVEKSVEGDVAEEKEDSDDETLKPAEQRWGGGGLTRFLGGGRWTPGWGGSNFGGNWGGGGFGGNWGGSGWSRNWGGSGWTPGWGGSVWTPGWRGSIFGG